MTPVELSLVVSNPTADEVKADALAWPDRARALVITNEPTYIEAGTLLKGIKGLRAKIADVFDKHISAAFQAHRALVKEKADAEAPLTEAEGIIKRSLVAFSEEQERIRREEQRRLEDLARKQAEEQALAEAQALEAAGATAEAQQVIEEAAAAPAPVVMVESSTPKMAGISYRSTWKWRTVNEKLIPREYLTVDTVKIGGVVRALKGATNIPGVQAYEDKGVASGRG
jgi:hypothetical protein